MPTENQVVLLNLKENAAKRETAMPEERDLYKVLGLDPYCTPEDIRLAYKKLALQRHPDKLVPSGVSEEDATAQFQELIHAYEVLFDAKERARYHSRRSLRDPFSYAKADAPAPAPAEAEAEADAPVPAYAEEPIMKFSPFFSKSAFSDYSDTGSGYYKVYSDLFGRVYATELRCARKKGVGVRRAPPMGNLDSPYAQVTAFYKYWMGFGTVMVFRWVNRFDLSLAEDMEERRALEEKNQMWREMWREEYNAMVRGLADFVMKRDKRVIDMAVKRAMEKKKKRQEERRKRHEMKKKLEKMRAARTDPEWESVEEEEDLIFSDEDEDVIPGMETLRIRKRWSCNAWCDRGMKKDPKKKGSKPRHRKEEEEEEFGAIKVLLELQSAANLLP